MTGREIQNKIKELPTINNLTASEIAALINCSSIQKTSAMCYSLEKFHNYLTSKVIKGKRYFSKTA